MTSLSLKSRFRNRTSEDKKEERQQLVTVPVPAPKRVVGTECVQKSSFSFSAAFFHSKFFGSRRKINVLGNFLALCYILSMLHLLENRNINCV